MVQKFIAFILAGLLMMVFPSCAEGGTKDTESDSIDETEAQSEAQTEEDKPDPLAFLPKELSFDGEDFVILNVTRYKADSGIEEVAVNFDDIEPGDIVAEAVYERNMRVTDRLGVNISQDDSMEFWDWQTKFLNSYAAGDGAYDAVVGATCASSDSYGLIPSIRQNAIANLADIDTIDLTHSWWDQRVFETLAFGENKEYSYLLAGDINFIDNFSTATLYFNKTMCTEYGFEYPYQLVRDGKWTIDELIKMTSDVYIDHNNNGEVDDEDTTGFDGDYASLANIISGFDMGIIEFDETGYPVANTTEEMYNAIQYVLDNFIAKQSVSTAKEGGSYGTMFMHGRAMFTQGTVQTLMNFREIEVEFGVLPWPKYNEAQENYAGKVYESYPSLYAVVNADSEQLDMCGYILDAMGAASVDTITTAVIDKYAMTRNVRDQDSYDMLQIVFDSAYYPFADSFDVNLGGLLNDICQTRENNYLTKLTKINSALQKKIGKLLDDMTKFDS